ncbi:MAG: prepilin-type N-terminal cleavage/methylation domain-containing protein [Methylococcaceae bacterium]
MYGMIKNKPQVGFTLLEILIATSLLGLMMLVLMGSLRIGAASWDAGENRMAQSERLNTLHHFLRHHIEAALPVTGMSAKGRNEYLFQGGSDFLEYVAPLPAQVKTGGLYRFRLYVAEEEQRQSLRLAMLPYISPPAHRPGLMQEAPPPEVEPIDDLEILDDMAYLKISYLARTLPHPQNGAEPVEWEDEWLQNTMPALVRIELSPATGAAWPALLIAPKILRIR